MTWIQTQSSSDIQWILISFFRRSTPRHNRSNRLVLSVLKWIHHHQECVSPLTSPTWFTCCSEAHMSFIKREWRALFQAQQHTVTGCSPSVRQFQSKSDLPADASSTNLSNRETALCSWSKMNSVRPCLMQFYFRNHLFHLCAWQHVSSSFNPV